MARVGVEAMAMKEAWKAVRVGARDVGGPRGWGVEYVGEEGVHNPPGGVRTHAKTANSGLVVVYMDRAQRPTVEVLLMGACRGDGGSVVARGRRRNAPQLDPAP